MCVGLIQQLKIIREQRLTSPKQEEIQSAGFLWTQTVALPSSLRDNIGGQSALFKVYQFIVFSAKKQLHRNIQNKVWPKSGQAKLTHKMNHHSN